MRSYTYQRTIYIFSFQILALKFINTRKLHEQLVVTLYIFKVASGLKKVGDPCLKNCLLSCLFLIHPFGNNCLQIKSLLITKRYFNIHELALGSSTQKHLATISDADVNPLPSIVWSEFYSPLANLQQSHVQFTKRSSTTAQGAVGLNHPLHQTVHVPTPVPFFEFLTQ